MHIKLVEIGHFRKLEAVRIDLEEKTTLFVGANNSGKTSAMVALRHFLIDGGNFAVHDFTLSNWPKLDAAGKAWEDQLPGMDEPVIDWDALLPHLDLWLSVEPGELHHVQKLLPTLDWDGEPIGVRLRFEPKDVEVLRKGYLDARAKAKAVLAALPAAGDDSPAGPLGFAPWPATLTDFLSVKLRSAFAVRTYLLNPAELALETHGIASPQVLPPDGEPVEGDPLRAVIRIDEINAQRGFGFVHGKSPEDGEAELTRGAKRLSTQLRLYYTHHLDPSDSPAPEDATALAALHEAQEKFSDRLAIGFKSALDELRAIGYPGVSDPRLTVTARIKAVDGLSHPSAVQYEVPASKGGATSLRLPEDSNGLGYQNLVSIVFALMSFRDKWMRVGKASSDPATADEIRPPLHLVLIEEPEAHLHAQVQQVFIKQAYAVLRKNAALGEQTTLRTQLVVSTHSSHVAHEVDFASLRYFRRLPVGDEVGSIPVSSVINLKDTFETEAGADDAERETAKFAKRYLKATHCDLFFADGAILVEGPAERILVPHLVRTRKDYEYLDRCYISWLEIGGSHAHRLRPLLERIGLNTLIITDIDAMNATRKAVPPARGQSLKARNETLRSWVPGSDDLDHLLSVEEDDLVLEGEHGYAVKVAYQKPIAYEVGGKIHELLANTFEDALLYENMALFGGLRGKGLMAKFRSALDSHGTNFGELAKQIHQDLARGKAELAMDLLYSDAIDTLAMPGYIHRGLIWLEGQLRAKEDRLDAIASDAGPPPEAAP
ncbi:AAA family ATPase [Piscinibacter sakaiensis]|uniref:AAA family ATPase n=1 Tax=Piscinibacter sakaiensis TaxID=1547922 RepID=UPI003AACF32B